MAIIGHDLKQPVQVISLMLGQLRGCGKDQCLDMALGEIGRLAAGLDRLALLSQDDGHLFAQVRQGPTDLNAVMREVCESWRHQAEIRGLALRFVPTTLAVESNARLLSVILANLVSNAIKYTSSGGILVGCRRRGGDVVVEVVDTGRGFKTAPATGFAPFWREDNDQEGLGLGLAIVQQTASLMGHRVLVQSELTRGSRVSVTMCRA